MTIKIVQGGKALPAGESVAIIAKLRKQRGETVLLKGSDVPLIERIPTGLFEVDLALGGGFPRQRISIVYGPEGSGKSNLCACVAASAQKYDHPECNKVVWVDLEGTMDPTWMAKFGINMDDLIVVKPSYGEEAGDIIDALIRASDVSLIVIDSLAALTSTRETGDGKDEAGKSLSDFDVGTSAILAKRLVNKIVQAFAAQFHRGHKPTVIFINQTRFKIGTTHGDPETMPGGKAVLFNSALTIRLHGKGEIDKKLHPTLPVVRITNAKVKKSKVPIRQVAFEYNLVVVPVENNGVTLPVGTTESWSVVKARLQASEDIKPAKGGGYMMFGKFYKILDLIRADYYNDRALQQKCQSAVLANVKDVIMTVEASGAAATKSDFNAPEKSGFTSFLTKGSAATQEPDDDPDPTDIV